MNTRALDDSSLRESGEQLEIWNAGDGESYVYTNSWRLVRALKRKFGEGAEYIRNGVTLAWQFRIPRRFVNMLTRNFRRLVRLEIDEGTIVDEFAKTEGSPEEPEV
jgi:hypothetical protein